MTVLCSMPGCQTTAGCRCSAVTPMTETQHAQNARTAEHRRCVEWLHRRADSMNDPAAKAVLNTAAYALGNSRAILSDLHAERAKP